MALRILGSHDLNMWFFMPSAAISLSVSELKKLPISLAILTSRSIFIINHTESCYGLSVADGYKSHADHHGQNRLR